MEGVDPAAEEGGSTLRGGHKAMSDRLSATYSRTQEGAAEWLAKSMPGTSSPRPTVGCWARGGGPDGEDPIRCVGVN